MKTRIIASKRLQSTTGFFRFLLFLFLSISLAQTARAGLNFTVDLYVSDGNYVFYTPLDTNDIAPAEQFGTYSIFSPEWPSNGSWRQLVYDDTGVNTVDGAENGYSDLASALYQITNGTWTIQFSNAVVTNTYHFTVSLPGGLASNKLPVTIITSPAYNAVGITNEPTVTWEGQPANWPVTGSIYFLQFSTNEEFYYPDPNPVSTSQTSYTIPIPIPAESPTAYVGCYLDYVTNYTGTLFTATTPTTSSSQLTGWTYNSILESGGQVQFTVAAPPNSSTNHTLIAHYAFDNSSFLGEDLSTNGNSLYCGETWGGGQAPAFTSDAEAGAGAAQFFGQGSLEPCYGETAYENWINTLSGSFTVSAWIKTSTVVGSDRDELNDFHGQTIIDNNNIANGVTPLGITGTKAAMETATQPGAGGNDTLNSQNDVVTGAYVHVAVTRDAGSGLKQIYINGALDSADYGEPGILNGVDPYIGIGGLVYAPYTGELDDVQIYSGVLQPSDIVTLYNNPGQTVANGNVITFAEALGTPGLNWTTSGDTSWFVESTNTDNGAPEAAQSGIVENQQTSTLTLTLTGPAYLSWNWAAQGNIYDFDYEAYLDGDSLYGYLDDISYDTDWVSDGPFSIPSGQHTVSWTAFADSDEDPTEAGFLDQVSVTSAQVELVNPQINGSNFQVTFTAKYGFNYTVYTSTNLATAWVVNSTIEQDGLNHVISVPTNAAPQQFISVVPQ